MSELSVTISDGLADAYRRYAERVHSLAAELSEVQFWTKPYPYGNSFGHLVLHLTGNLNHFIGAQIAGTGYVRDREREFTDTSKPPKASVLEAFGDAVKMVVVTVKAQSDESWSRADEALRAEDRFSEFLNCLTHLRLHVGQMIYLEKELQNPQRSVS